MPHGLKFVFTTMGGAHFTPCSAATSLNRVQAAAGLRTWIP